MMEECHAGRVKLMNGIMNMLSDLNKDIALEACCGDGRLSKDLLTNIFDEVDLFDQCPQAIDKVKSWAKEVNSIKAIDLASM